MVQRKETVRETKEREDEKKGRRMRGENQNKM